MIGGGGGYTIILIVCRIRFILLSIFVTIDFLAAIVMCNPMCFHFVFCKRLRYPDALAICCFKLCLHVQTSHFSRNILLQNSVSDCAVDLVWFFCCLKSGRTEGVEVYGFSSSYCLFGKHMYHQVLHMLYSGWYLRWDIGCGIRGGIGYLGSLDDWCYFWIIIWYQSTYRLLTSLRQVVKWQSGHFCKYVVY